MKICLRYRWGVCALLTALAGALAVSCGGGISIIAMNGKSPYAIVLSASPSASERHAAEELRTYIARATGAELPVVAETDARSGFARRRGIHLTDGENRTRRPGHCHRGRSSPGNHVRGLHISRPSRVPVVHNAGYPYPGGKDAPYREPERENHPYLHVP